MSSRQPLASLSTRTGRLRSRSKETLQRLRVEGAGGTGGGGGAVIPTEVVAVACLPRSSTTLQVTVTVPGGIAGGVERGGRAIATDLAGGGRVGVGERTVLRAVCQLR